MPQNIHTLPIPITKEQLDWVVAELDLRESAKTRLESILVNQEKPADVAQRDKLSKQAVYKLLRHANEEYNRRLTETGLVPVTVFVREESVGVVESMQKL